MSSVWLLRLLRCSEIVAWRPGRWRVHWTEKSPFLSNPLKASPTAMLTLLYYFWLKDFSSFIYSFQIGLTPCARYESSHLSGLLDPPAVKNKCSVICLNLCRFLFTSVQLKAWEDLAPFFSVIKRDAVNPEIIFGLVTSPHSLRC